MQRASMFAAVGMITLVLSCASSSDEPKEHVSSSAAALDTVSGFGPNPGNLLMFRYAPMGVPPKAPLVVVLHGCGGFSTFDHRLAATLPGYGISTLDVDYFAPTPPPGSKGFCDARGAPFAFSTWAEVASAAAAKLRATPGIDERGVGVVGWSLGGAVALAAAAGPRSSRPFDAVAGFSTGSFHASASAAELPPTILLSGGRTDAIPLAETLPLYQALKAAGVPTQLYVYPRGSHNWPGRQGTLGIEHAAAFLQRYLR